MSTAARVLSVLTGRTCRDDVAAARARLARPGVPVRQVQVPGAVVELRPASSPTRTGPSRAPEA